ncbi:hypothetical protein QP185_17125 [Sphingomonas aerolata]|uniref:hypothetical protein n=1 Tax=Sphingomonas aerolata TaxID=185951 RepID=UPI002FE1E875
MAVAKGGGVGVSCPYAFLVILTKVRIQGYDAVRLVTLDPDFRQDDGVGEG